MHETERVAVKETYHKIADAAAEVFREDAFNMAAVV